MKRKTIIATICSLILILIAVPIVLLASLPMVERSENAFIINGKEYVFTSVFSAVKKEKIIGQSKEGLFFSVADDNDSSFVYLQAWPFHREYNLLISKEASDIKSDPEHICTLECEGHSTCDSHVIDAFRKALITTESDFKPELPAKFYEVRVFYEGLPQVYSTMAVLAQPSGFVIEANGLFVSLSDDVEEWLESIIR